MGGGLMQSGFGMQPVGAQPAADAESAAEEKPLDARMLLLVNLASTYFSLRDFTQVSRLLLPLYALKCQDKRRTGGSKECCRAAECRKSFFQVMERAIGYTSGLFDRMNAEGL